MKPVLIIRTGRAPDRIRARHGDFPHWFRLGAGLHPRQLQIIDVAAGEALPAPREVAVSTPRNLDPRITRGLRAN